MEDLVLFLVVVVVLWLISRAVGQSEIREQLQDARNEIGRLESRVARLESAPRAAAPASAPVAAAPAKPVEPTLTPAYVVRPLAPVAAHVAMPPAAAAFVQARPAAFAPRPRMGSAG